MEEFKKKIEKLQVKFKILDNVTATYQNNEIKDLQDSSNKMREISQLEEQLEIYEKYVK